MNVVADAVKDLQRVYENASLAIRASSDTIAGIRQTILDEGDEHFRALGEDLQRTFLTELGERVNHCCGSGTLSAPMIKQAIEKQTLNIPGLIPQEMRLFRSHVRHAVKWAIPETNRLAA